MSSRANQENNPMADNENRQWSTAPDGNQDEKSLRLGISIDGSRSDDLSRIAHDDDSNLARYV
jgi:hypothetical protein